MDKLLVGRVGKVHGVRGEVKVAPETDEPERFAELETVYVGRTPETARAHAIESVRLQPMRGGVTVVLKLEGVDTREEAESLRRLEVYAAEDELPPLEEDEVYLHDLIGLTVVTEAGEAVGTLSDIIQMPAHDVYVVQREGKPDALIPAVPEFIVDIDLDEERLVIRPIEGLLE